MWILTICVTWISQLCSWNQSYSIVWLHYILGLFSHHVICTHMHNCLVSLSGITTNWHIKALLYSALYQDHPGYGHTMTIGSIIILTRSLVTTPHLVCDTRVIILWYVEMSILSSIPALIQRVISQSLRGHCNHENKISLVLINQIPYNVLIGFTIYLLQLNC